MSANAMQEYLKGSELLTYIEQFPDAYAAAVRRSGVSVETVTDDKRALGKFYQCFWEELPDTAQIRHGAFYKICDFAEEYCFPS